MKSLNRWCSIKIGSNCWKEENQTFSLCSDTVGIITPTEPLLARSSFTAHLHLPLQEPPEEVGFSATRVTDDDELKVSGNDVRAWRFVGKEGNWNKLPSELEIDRNLSLEPGLYVLNIFVKWKDKGDVAYGFLVNVYDPTAVPAETHKASTTGKAAGFEAVLGITILLAVYTDLRKKINREK